MNSAFLLLSDKPPFLSSAEASFVVFPFPPRSRSSPLYLSSPSYEKVELITYYNLLSRSVSFSRPFPLLRIRFWPLSSPLPFCVRSRTTGRSRSILPFPFTLQTPTVLRLAPFFRLGFLFFFFEARSGGGPSIRARLPKTLHASAAVFSVSNYYFTTHAPSGKSMV